MLHGIRHTLVLPLARQALSLFAWSLFILLNARVADQAILELTNSKLVHVKSYLCTLARSNAARVFVAVHPGLFFQICWTCSAGTGCFLRPHVV